MKSETVSTRQQRIAELAEKHPQLSFTSLAYHIDMEWLKEAYRLTRKDGAAGVDGQTAADYERDLAGNLKGLLERFHTGRYVAPPVRRAYIPKDGGEKRPIGIPTLEDKILQRAVVMLLTPIYEHDFLSCSHGFRPCRSAHTALQALWESTMSGRECWVLEVDVRRYFDTVKHEYLRAFLGRRVSDGVVRRNIGKWLKAGVMEDGAIRYREEGTPQGGVLSPMLSNIYLHEVLDLWFENEIRRRLQGRAELIRYADDFVIVFENEHDARRVEEVLHKRFEKYGLTLHAEKTRIVNFGRPEDNDRPTNTFNFLGFTHYWGESRKGRPVVKRKTAKRRLARALKRVFGYCKVNRHSPINEQWEMLCSKVRGHFEYYGITNNSRSLEQYRQQTARIWRYWLNRRSRNKDMPWKRFKEILKQLPLPRARIVHSYLAKA
jgi:group II intron reverse transcriptase/maturase